MKRGKKMKGLMCQSPSSTAVCMASETLSVIVSRRMDYNYKLANDINHGSKYIRLRDHPEAAAVVVPPRPRRNALSTSTTKSMTFPSLSIPVKNSEEKQSKDLVPVLDAKEDQVVVMRVSIHCQGCAGKVKKHLAKMEGVTSFSIDLESKRVIVRGHVSAVGVLDSLSKIKRAELLA